MLAIKQLAIGDWVIGGWWRVAKDPYQDTGFSRAVIEEYKATLAAGLLIVLNQPAEQQPVMVVKQRTGRAVPMTSELANKIADE